VKYHHQNKPKDAEQPTEKLNLCSTFGVTLGEPRPGNEDGRGGYEGVPEVHGNRCSQNEQGLAVPASKDGDAVVVHCIAVL